MTSAETNQPSPEYLSIAKAAAALDISEDTFLRRFRPALLRGEIASLKIGRLRRVHRGSLEAYLRDHNDGATAAPRKRGH